MRKLIPGIITLLAGVHAFAQPLVDVPGSKDLEGLPRVADTTIVAFKYSEYDAAPFVRGKRENRLEELVEPEGERFRFIYAGVPTQSPLQLIRNYQKAFRQFGDFELIYECSGNLDCSKMIAQRVVWREGNRMPVEVPGGGLFRHSYPNHDTPRYFYGTVDRNGDRYHVSGFAVLHKIGGEAGAQIPFLHLEILREEDFSDDLEFVSSGEMQDQIESTGAIALYGITFEFDSAELTPASTETVAEIAKLLTMDTSLSLFVVGHTDNQGELGYNEALSERRAASIVNALVEEHGIEARRLTSRGVGPLAPVASNDTETGRAMNRRVEIVKRALSEG